jgi:hypothetical protein
MSIETRKKPLVLGPRLAGTAMTLEEFDAVTRYNENYRYELINGVLVVNPQPLPAETDPNEQLGFSSASTGSSTRKGGPSTRRCPSST